MKKDMLSKTLVVGVVVLFIGVGVQPAFAVETKDSSIDTVQMEEDCDCQIVDESIQDRVIQLLNEVKVFVNNVLLKFGYIPYVKEKCQELLDVINSFNPLSGPLIICAMLYTLAWGFIDIGRYYMDKHDETGNYLYFYIAWFFVLSGIYTGGIARELDCDWINPDNIYNIEIQKIVSQNLGVSR